MSGLSGKAAGLLGPQLLQSAVQNQFERDKLATNALLGFAELANRETPQQRLNRELLLALLNVKPQEKKTHRLSLNLDPSGKRTPQHDKYVWLVDDEGNRLKVIGPDTEKLPDSDASGAGLDLLKNELIELKHAENRAHELLALKYPDKLIKDELTGQWRLVGEMTPEMWEDFQSFLYDQVLAAQERQAVRDPITVPPIGQVSLKSGAKKRQDESKKEKF